MLRRYHRPPAARYRAHALSFPSVAWSFRCRHAHARWTGVR